MKDLAALVDVVLGRGDAIASVTGPAAWARSPLPGEPHAINDAIQAARIAAGAAEHEELRQRLNDLQGGVNARVAWLRGEQHDAARASLLPGMLAELRRLRSGM